MADLKSTHRNPLPRIAELDIRLNDDSENKPLHTCIRIGTEELEHDEFCLRIGLREAVLELAVEGYDVNQHGRLGEVSLDHVAKVAHSQSTSSSTARQTKKGISAKGALDGSILKGQANATAGIGTTRETSNVSRTQLDYELDTTFITARGGNTWDLKNPLAAKPIEGSIGLKDPLCTLSVSQANRSYVGVEIWARKRAFTIDCVQTLSNRTKKKVSRNRDAILAIHILKKLKQKIQPGNTTSDKFILCDGFISDDEY